jgi:DNA polymerase III delta prime subunit
MLKKIKIKKIRKIGLGNVINITVKKNHNFRIKNNICVWNCDNLSPDALLALRPVLEMFSENTNIIATCNYPQKLPEPILSRFQQFEFLPIKKEEAIEYIKRNILEKEGISFDEEKFENLFISSDGDLRKMVNCIQRSVIDKKIVIKENDYITEFLKVFKSKDVQLLKKYLSENNLDYLELLRFVYNQSKTVDQLLVVAEGLYKHSLVLDKEISFAGVVCKLWSLK